MKVTTGVVLASLATAGLAHRSARHARFHDEKRYTEVVEANKRALEADPSLAKRCGEIVNTASWGSFPNCWGPCAGQNGCPGGPGGQQQESQPAASPAAPAASSAAPAASQVQVNEAFAKPPSSKPASSAAPAATSTAASSSNSGSNSGSGSYSGKVQWGLTYDTASFIDSSWLSNGAISWAANWNPVSNGLNTAGHNVQFVPELHTPDWVGAFLNDKSGFADGVPVLSLNEPDWKSSGSCGYLSPAEACTVHKSAFSNIGNHPVGSPAVTSNQPGSGGQPGPLVSLDWLAGFQSACSDAKIGFVPLHWYGGGGSGAEQAAAFISYAQKAQSKVAEIYPNTPIWFSEVAATPITDASVNAEFLTAVKQSLAKDNLNIERLAPFMVGPNGCLGTTSPNAAGKVLLGLS